MLFLPGGNWSLSASHCDLVFTPESDLARRKEMGWLLCGGGGGSAAAPRWWLMGRECDGGGGVVMEVGK